ncbi:hypothetical protein [Rhodoferax sp. GW822-FHT02A01]|uniref:hypothetical protein n=1 Tax=Rhodoferax sp. GW822-FHT02A01 TaxID=3141537 RepID=UPI00315D02D8
MRRAVLDAAWGQHDPAVRSNALAALCDPDGLLGDVRDVLVSSSTAFRLSVRDVERAFAFPRPPYALDPDGVKRQLADLFTRGDASLHALLHCGQCVQGIDRWSKASLHEDAPDLGALLRLLSSLASFADAPERGVKTYADEVRQEDAHKLAASGMSGAQDAALLFSDHGASERDTRSVAMTLPLQTQGYVAQEREQIRVLLQQVRAWIEHHEPSSPVAILIKQADRMWGKRFSEVATMIPPDLMQAWDRDD